MQLAFDMHSPIPKESYDYGLRSDGESHGLVLTKPHVVELILDLAGYTTDRDLGGIRLLEPACGHGAFLAPAIERLLDSARNRGRSPNSLSSALSAYDIVQEHVETTRRLAAKVCRDRGVSSRDAVELAESWIHQGDFLLAPKPGVFDTVVGNPPYVRIEQLPRALQREYRERFSTIYDRADLYVPFIERGLSLLSPQGLLSFICTDRWTLNKYGAPLRSFITRDFYVRSYFDLHRASPFESDVIAYPSIFAIGREKTSAPTVIASISTASPSECSAARAVVRGDSAKASGLRVHTCDSWFVGGDPWVLSSSKQLATLRELEERFPLLEDDGRTSVRIGVATGADKILIVPMGTDIEEDRLVPLVMREDILAGKVHDGHRFVIDTSPPEGGVVDLDRYPKLSRYLEQHRAALTQRHVGRKRAGGWFKTIDRVVRELTHRPKLLIPDISGANEVAYESGRFYPHHNFYFIVSDAWDLEVLGGLLSSRVALFFVWSYAVKMRGGYLRFQAQYLRRIRVPPPESVPRKLADEIRAAYRDRRFSSLDALACEAYGIEEVPDFNFLDTRR